MLITLSGIDGTGKSTVAAGIQHHLHDSYGVSSRYVWCKFGKHPLSGFRLGRYIGGGRLGGARRPSATKGKPDYVRRLYLWSMLVFHMQEIRVAIRRPLQQGHAVVCDRYIVDTIIDLAQELNLPVAQSRKLFQAAWIPRPNSGFLLDLPAAVAFRRKPDSASVSFLEERRRLYLRIATVYNLVVVDSTQPLETVTRIVIEQIRAGNVQKEILGS